MTHHCVLCGKPIEHSDLADFDDDGCPICQQCAASEGGVILDDEPDPNDRGEFGLGGDWWRDTGGD